MYSCAQRHAAAIEQDHLPPNQILPAIAIEIPHVEREWS
jgi:hypothetical protein